MIRSRAGTDLDPTVWPAFDAAALPARWRSTFLARRQAVELYVANVAVTQIEQRTGVDRRQLYRLLDHCAAPHEDGRVFGWRGLVPYARVDDYVRTARRTKQSNHRPRPGDAHRMWSTSVAHDAK